MDIREFLVESGAFQKSLEDFNLHPWRDSVIQCFVDILPNSVDEVTKTHGIQLSNAVMSATRTKMPHIQSFFRHLKVQLENENKVLVLENFTYIPISNKLSANISTEELQKKSRLLYLCLFSPQWLVLPYILATGT